MNRTRLLAGLIFVSGVGLVVAGLSGVGERTDDRFRWSTPDQVGATQLDAGYRFEQNQGQFDQPVRYLARGQGYGLYLTRDGATLILRRPKKAPAVLTMRLAGGRPVEPAGVGELPGKSNYFIGNDRSRWRTGVPSFCRVRYAQVLAGVDLEYYGTDERQAEYDLVLAAGSDPSRLALTFGGAESIAVDGSGSARLALSGGGEVVKPSPVAYQTDVDGNRTLVAARYEKRGKDQLGFVLGAYDRSRPLVIDPVFAYSTLLGGNSNERGQAITVDGSGSAYLVGYTTSANFPLTSAFQGTNGSLAGGNVFVTKLGPSGAPSPVYSTYLGGTGTDGDRAFGVAVDGSGNAYIVGEASSTDFPLLAPFQGTLNGGRDAFVTKLNATGNGLLYSTYLGGENLDGATSVAVDSGGNAYVTGQTASAAFPIKAPALQGTKGTAADINTVFVTKLNPTGSALVYSTYLGGDVEEYGGGIAVDGAGNAFVTGSTGSANFPKVTPFQAALAPPLDAFVSKINAAGSALLYSTFLGGTGFEFGNDIAIDGSGNAYVTGFTTATNFPIKSPALQSANNAATFTTAFVTKLNTAGTTLAYSTYLGGTVEDVGMSIATDSGGNAYITGFTRSSDFRSSAPVQPYGGERDAFVSKLNPAGSALVFSTHLGGAADDSGTGIAADTAGSAYVTGDSGSWNFPTPETAFQPFLSGDFDAFAVKLAASGTFPPIRAKTKRDAVLVTANTTNSAGCGGVAFNSSRTLSVTDLNGDGLVCPGCTGTSYAPSDALDFIRLAFYGVHHDAAKTRNCGSDVRRTLLANYNNLFQTSCSAGTCAGKPVFHLYRLNEMSETVTTLNGILGTTTNQLCNVHNGPVVTAQGTDFLDNDPIRVACTGNGKTGGEQVCGSAAEGKAKTLGMLLTIFVPDFGDATEAYPLNYCTTGAVLLLPATKSTYTGFCPAGNPSFGGKCFSSVYRTTNPDGSFNYDANCVQWHSIASCPTLTPTSNSDCRGANVWLRNSDGTIVKDTTFPPGMVPPNTGRLFTGAFYKLQANAPLVTGGSICGTADFATEQIACLTGSAHTCSLGFGARRTLGIPLPANVSGLAVNGVLPEDPGVYYGTYPLSF